MEDQTQSQHEERSDASGLKEYQPQTFGPRHRLAVELQQVGYTNKEIASKLGYSESRVSVILNDPRAEEIAQEARSRVADKVSDVRLKLELLSEEAVDELAEEMRLCKDPSVRQRAAKTILDRAGYSKVNKHLVGQAELPAEAAEDMARALAESKGQELEANYSWSENGSEEDSDS